MTHKYINGFMCPLPIINRPNLLDYIELVDGADQEGYDRDWAAYNKYKETCTPVPEEHRSHFVEGQEYQEGVDFEKGGFCQTCTSLGGGIRHCAHPEECSGAIEIAIPIIKAGQEDLWDEALTAVPVRVHPMTENYFKNNFIIKRK